MTTDTLQWWATTWGRLAPGDEVRAPDGSVWAVGASITSDGAGEWRIVRDGRDVWTPHREDEPVTARRPHGAGHISPDAGLLLGRLRSVLGPVEEVLATAPPGANRWSACGRQVCTCRH